MCSYSLLCLVVFCEIVSCRDFYAGMFRTDDYLVAQDRLYKEKAPFRSTIAKYGRYFKCPITYFRVVDRLGVGGGPHVLVTRGGLKKKFLTLRLTSPYNLPISVNIYVGCAKYKKKVIAAITKVATTTVATTTVATTTVATTTVATTTVATTTVATTTVATTTKADSVSNPAGGNETLPTPTEDATATNATAETQTPPTPTNPTDNDQNPPPPTNSTDEKDETQPNDNKTLRFKARVSKKSMLFQNYHKIKLLF